MEKEKKKEIVDRLIQIQVKIEEAFRLMGRLIYELMEKEKK